MRILKIILIVVALLVAWGLFSAWRAGAWNLLFPKDDHDTVAPQIPSAVEGPAVLVFTKTNGFRHVEGIAGGLEAMQAMLADNPDDAFCLYGIAQEYLNDGACDVAVGYFDKCLKVDPDYLYAYYHKARALEELDRIDDAIRTLEAGHTRANAAGDAQAISEIAGYLDTLR